MRKRDTLDLVAGAPTLRLPIRQAGGPQSKAYAQKSQTLASLEIGTFIPHPCGGC